MMIFIHTHTLSSCNWMMYDAPYKLTTNSMSPTIHNLVHISTWETIIVRYDPSSWIGAPPLIIMHASLASFKLWVEKSHSILNWIPILNLDEILLMLKVKVHQRIYNGKPTPYDSISVSYSCGLSWELRPSWTKISLDVTSQLMYWVGLLNMLIHWYTVDEPNL